LPDSNRPQGRPREYGRLPLRALADARCLSSTCRGSCVREVPQRDEAAVEGVEDPFASRQPLGDLLLADLCALAGDDPLGPWMSAVGVPAHLRLSVGLVEGISALPCRALKDARVPLALPVLARPAGAATLRSVYGPRIVGKDAAAVVAVRRLRGTHRSPGPARRPPTPERVAPSLPATSNGTQEKSCLWRSCGGSFDGGGCLMAEGVSPDPVVVRRHGAASLSSPRLRLRQGVARRRPSRA
jgi:hypothetical protein